MFAALSCSVATGCATESMVERSQATAVADPSLPAQATLLVEVDGVVPGRGLVRGAMYGDRATFLSESGVSCGQTVSAEGETVAFVWTVEANRELVISVFQDIDSDGALDRGRFGIPSEPWGFSNDPSPLLPPTWNACAISPAAGIQPIRIRLRGAPRGS
jgi:uncharacterized protein (DUF2141 family)